MLIDLSRILFAISVSFWSWAWRGTTVAVLLDEDGSDQWWVGGEGFRENQSEQSVRKAMFKNCKSKTEAHELNLKFITYERYLFFTKFTGIVISGTSATWKPREVCEWGRSHGRSVHGAISVAVACRDMVPVTSASTSWRRYFRCRVWFTTSC